MDYSPPPLFKQGASARVKVVIFSLIAIVLLVADARLDTLAAIRQVVGTVLYPLQRLALMPRDAAYSVGTYFSSLSRLEQENTQFKQRQVANAQTLQQVQLLAAENAQLRRLLGASERLPVKSLMSEILYDARDPFTRKIVLDRGSRHGVAAGQPVIDDAGVIGQITRVFPFTSEATLLTDKDQAIPVQVVRSGLRSIAYGRGQSGVLDLRYIAPNADIKKGDLLVTSGIDGVYPAGLAVARVERVEHKSADAFASIICLPAAGIDRNRQLLILLSATVPPLLTDDKSAPPSAAIAPPAKDGASAANPPAKVPGASAPAVRPAPAAPTAPAVPAAAVKPAVNQAAAPAIKPVAPAAATRVQPGGAVAAAPAVPAANTLNTPRAPAPAAKPSTTVPTSSTTTLRPAPAPAAPAAQARPAPVAPAAQVRPAASPASISANPLSTPAAARPASVPQSLPVELRP